MRIRRRHDEPSWTIEAQTPLEAEFLNALLRGLAYAYGPESPLHPMTPSFVNERGEASRLTTADMLPVTECDQSSTG